MQTFFTNENDSLIDRAIDSGNAFDINASNDDLSAGNSIVLEVTTMDKPVYLLSRILKSNSNKLDYKVYTGASLAGNYQTSPCTTSWLNQIRHPNGSPPISCLKHIGATLTGGA